MMPTWTYAKAPDGVTVNLYVGSTAMLEDVGGVDVEMVQKTDYPWSGKVSVTVNPKTRKRFTVRLRIPNRATSELYTPSPRVQGLVSLAVNGTPLRPTIENGYAVIAREWKSGDVIEMELPLKPQTITATEQIAATRGKAALRYGPLIYNVESADQDLAGALDPEAPLVAEWRGDLLGGVMAINGKFAGGASMLAIPNYARTNRQRNLPVEAGPLAADPALYMGPNARRPEASAGGGRQEPAPPPVSVVWIRRAPRTQ